MTAAASGCSKTPCSCAACSRSSILLQLVSQRREERSLLDLVLAEARESKFSERERITTMGVSLVEQWKAEGKAEGRAEGLSIAEQWKAEGKAEGETETARELLATALETRFGPLPAAYRQALAEADAGSLKAWHRQALTAPTLEAIGLIPDRSAGPASGS